VLQHFRKRKALYRCVGSARNDAGVLPVLSRNACRDRWRILRLAELMPVFGAENQVVACIDGRGSAAGDMRDLS